MRRQHVILLALVVLLTGTIAGTARSTNDAFKPRWVAGDLHIHTPYSHDSWGPHDDNTDTRQAYLAGNTVERHFAIAATRGLDYLAITDHNDVRSQADAGFGTSGVVGIPGYEASLSGHAQMLGATEIYNKGSGVAGVRAMADLLRSRGGVFQINHPAGDSLHWPEDPDWGYGYDVVPDTVEVWNISPLWQPPAPSGHDQEGAIDYWEGWLDRGYKVGMTGGSDNHYVSTTAVQGAGQPTTWVYVEQRGAAGVLEGLRAGRTFVSAQPPAHRGVELFLEADVDGDRAPDARVGDTVPADAVISVRVENLPAGALVRAIYGGPDGRRRTVGCTNVIVVARCSLEDMSGTPTWVRAEAVMPDGRGERQAACDDLLGDRTTYCRNRLGILAMTSAIYIAQ